MQQSKNSWKLNYVWYGRFLNKKEQIEKEIERLKTTNAKPNDETNTFLKEQGTSEISVGTKLSELLKRTEITYKSLEKIDKKRQELDRQVTDEVEIMIKYDGYIELQKRQVEGFKKLEKKLLPEDLDYNTIKGIRLEARQKLNKYKPYSIGQASRISGVSPADINVLLVVLN